MFTFDLSATIAHVGLQTVYLNIFFIVTAMPIGLKFKIENPLDETMSKSFCGIDHMTNREY